MSDYDFCFVLLHQFKKQKKKKKKAKIRQLDVMTSKYSLQANTFFCSQKNAIFRKKRYLVVR